MTWPGAGLSPELVDATGTPFRVAHLPLDDARRVRALELLSGAESERQRRNPSDGFLLGRLLLQELAVELTGAPVAITAVCPQCGEEHGRPTSETLWLSVAHTDDVVVAAAARVPVGIDVERADAAVPAEFGGTAAAWTRLEAVLKADGRGVVVDPADVHFTATTATIGDTTYRVETRTLEAAAGATYVLSIATISGVREETSARAIPQKSRPGTRR